MRSLLLAVLAAYLIAAIHSILAFVNKRRTLERISLVLGIHKGLKLLFADEASGMRWLTSPNRDLPFGGVSPLERALRGSIDDLYAVRRYVDAWRGMK